MNRYLLLLFMLLLPGCGRIGALIPPESLVPAAVSDLKVAQRGERLVLSWTPPVREVGGGPLTEPTGFALYRRLVLPPAEDCEECPSAYRLTREVPPVQPREALVYAGQIHVDDTDLVVGTTYQFKAITTQKDGAASPPSNRARRRVVPPPAAPVVKGLSTTMGIVLSWEAVPAPADGAVTGYTIYRHRDGESFPPLPFATLPPDARGYEDLRLELKTRYHYGVRTVARVLGETVESVLSNEVTGMLAEGEIP